MRKTFVIDTSVLLHYEDSIHGFAGHDLVIPMEVLEELDQFKVRQDSVGNASRYVNRFLDEIRELGSLKNGITLENQQTIFVISGSKVSHLPVEMDDIVDNKIIACAYNLHHQGTDVTLISRDINMRIKCDSLGMPAEDYRRDKAKISRKGAYTGFSTVIVDDIDPFFDDGYIDISEDLMPNECILLKENSSQGSGLGLADGSGRVRKLHYAGGKDFSIQGISPRSKEQKFAMELLMDPNIAMVTLTGPAGSGKSLMGVAAALEHFHNGMYERIIVSRPNHSTSKDIGYLPGPQPLDAKILTPTGWTTMGQIKVGDQVISRDGYPTKVLGVYPKGEKDVYRILTSDGTSAECCEDHLWYTQTKENVKRKKPGSVKSTREIAETLLTKFDKPNHYLPRNSPVHFKKNDLPIPPYILGFVIGDGSITNTMSFFSDDFEGKIKDRLSSELMQIGCDIRKDQGIQYNVKNLIAPYNNKPARPVEIKNIVTGEIFKFDSVGKAALEMKINRSTIGARCETKRTVDGLSYRFLKKKIRWTNLLKEQIFKLGLLGKKCHDKFIPDIYKYSSIDDRISILQGIMDTDGTIKENGESSFTTTSFQLANDVTEIVRSLGGRATICKRDRRKEDSSRRKIRGRAINTRLVSYEFTISLPKEINPFYMDRKAKRHSKEYIHYPKIEKIEYVGKKDVQCILVENTEHLYITNDFIVTHNTKEEKLRPWLGSIFDNFRHLTKDEIYLERMIERGVFEMESLSFIRGRSLPNTLFIMDEAQNITIDEAKAVLTRMGENSKIILLGDLEQIDAPHITSSTSGLSVIVEKFKNFELSGHITLIKGERSALATHAAKIL